MPTITMISQLRGEESTHSSSDTSKSHSSEGQNSTGGCVISYIFLPETHGPKNQRADD